MSKALVKLGDICTTTQGVQITKANTSDRPYDGGYRYLYIADFISDKKLSFVDDNFDAKKVTENDLVMANTGSPGRVFKGKDGILSNNLFKISFDQNVVNRDYLYLMLSSNVFQNVLQKQMKGGIQKHLGHETISRQEIPLPPLAEQKRIAAILDKADNLRRKRQQAIKLADEFLRSVFLDMFGDPGLNPNNHPSLSLDKLKKAKLNNGVFRKNDDYGGKTPVAWVSELFSGECIEFGDKANWLDPTEKETASYGLKYGDILFCRSSLKLDGIGFNNVYLGKDNEALFECHVIRMSPDLSVINPVFLNYQLRMRNIRKRVFQQSKTVTMTTIDQDGLSRVEVIVPPLGLQEKFASIFMQLRSKRTVEDKFLEESYINFKSLSKKAFAGQL